MDDVHNCAATVPADAVCDCYEIFSATGAQCVGRWCQVFIICFQWLQMLNVVWKPFQVLVHNALAGGIRGICF